MGYFVLNSMKVTHIFIGEAGQETFIISAVRSLDLHVLEGLEEFWIPLVICSSTVVLSAALILTALWQFNTWMLCAAVG
jgi:hypothetical protein